MKIKKENGEIKKKNKNKKKANKEVQARQQVLVNTIETKERMVAFHNGGLPIHTECQHCNWLSLQRRILSI